MNAFKITLLVINHDNMSADEVRDELHHMRYPNDCISPSVMSIESRDIGEWHDRHPLNLSSQCEAEYQRLFNDEGK